MASNPSSTPIRITIRPSALRARSASAAQLLCSALIGSSPGRWQGGAGGGRGPRWRPRPAARSEGHRRRRSAAPASVSGSSGAGRCEQAAERHEVGAAPAARDRLQRRPAGRFEHQRVGGDQRATRPACSCSSTGSRIASTASVIGSPSGSIGSTANSFRRAMSRCGGELQRRGQQVLLGVEPVRGRGQWKPRNLGHAPMGDGVGADLGDDLQDGLEQRLAPGGPARAWSCLASSCLAWSCLAWSCLAWSCLAWSCFAGCDCRHDWYKCTRHAGTNVPIGTLCKLGPHRVTHTHHVRMGRRRWVMTRGVEPASRGCPHPGAVSTGSGAAGAPPGG